MEETGVLDSADYGGSTEGISLNQQSLGYLKETAKWATFLSVLGFIMIGLILLGGLGFTLFMSSSAMPGAGGFFGFGLVYLLFLGIYIYPILKLYQFATKCKRAVSASSTALMTEALSSLKSCYKFIGILTIITLAFYMLMLILGGASALFM